jgi:hypothetical protein
MSCIGELDGRRRLALAPQPLTFMCRQRRPLSHLGGGVLAARSYHWFHQLHRYPESKGRCVWFVCLQYGRPAGPRSFVSRVWDFNEIYPI